MTSTRRTTRPAPTAAPVEVLTTDELKVVAAWRSYKPGSNPDVLVTGGRLMTMRGKIYYDPDPATPEGRVCIGRTVASQKKEAYIAHTMVPADVLLAVAERADGIDTTPRDHQ